jgi:hypothetical protein
MTTLDSRVDSDQAGQWLSLREAAAALEIAEKTARRRVKSGQLQGRQVGTQHGQAWEVWVPSRGATAGRVDGQGTQSVQGPEGLALVALVERQQQTILELSGRCGYLQAELATARERLALMVPTTTPEMAPESTPEGEAVSRASTRRWWRFW